MQACESTTASTVSAPTSYGVCFEELDEKKKKTEVHKANLADDFQTIRTMLTQKQSATTISDWIANKQKEIYVHIDPNWSGCDFLYPNWVKE